MEGDSGSFVLCRMSCRKSGTGIGIGNLGRNCPVHILGEERWKCGRARAGPVNGKRARVIRQVPLGLACGTVAIPPTHSAQCATRRRREKKKKKEDLSMCPLPTKKKKKKTWTVGAILPIYYELIIL